MRAPAPPAVVLAAAVLLAAGCGSTQDGGSTAPSGEPDAVAAHLTAGEWLLDQGSSSLGDGDPGPITVRFSSDGAVSGTAPCNAYRGAYRLTGGSMIRITGLGQGQRSCGARIDAGERQYLDALASADAVSPPQPGRLVLTGAGGMRLAYSAVDASTSVIGRWDVVNVSRDNAIRGVSPGLDPVIAFTSDGTVTTSSRCGERTGTWSIDGERLRVSGLPEPARTCPPDGDAALDEAAIAGALRTASGVTATPMKMTVLGDEGNILLVATK